MKSSDNTVDLNLYAALFEDIVAWDPGLRSSVDADLRRLKKIVETRGLSFIMIDMPDAGRVIDKALSEGYLNAEKLPATFGKVISRPSREFLSGLLHKVFSQSSGIIYGDNLDATCIFFLRQVLYMAKKVRRNCSDATISAEVDSFRQVDSSLRSPTLDWDYDGDLLPLGRKSRLSFRDGYRRLPDLVSHRDVCPEPLLAILDRISGSAVSHFPEFDWRDIIPRHGPGATAEAGRYKIDKYLLSHWPDKLDRVFPYEYFSSPVGDLLPRESARSPLSLHEPSARLLAVPKTLKSPRLIAAEPMSHVFIQLGMMKWLRDNMPQLLRGSISFQDQEPSRLLCLEASKSGELATVDLSSASDRLSCWVVERIFQYNPLLLNALHACRTRTLNNSIKGTCSYNLRLRKFACMGSGVTFPVQTIVYTLVALACVIYEDGSDTRYSTLQRKIRKIRVFGDDIIMPSYAVPSFSLLLSHLGLKVNASKTHYNGRFRESCGMDAFRGYNVTPVYLRDLAIGKSSASLVSWLDVSNNAHASGLWFLANYLTDKLPLGFRNLLPISSRSLGCLTLRTFCRDEPQGVKRFNDELHRPEVLGLVPVSFRRIAQRESDLNLLQAFLEQSGPQSYEDLDFFWISAWKRLIRIEQTARVGWVVASSMRLRKEWVGW